MATIHVPQTASTLDNPLEEFKTEIMTGLSKPNKAIPSKYFYDRRGCQLFNQITRHPAYYLTRCEIEILTTYKATLANFLRAETFNLIELGPGEGIKTLILMEQFMHDALLFHYSPIDISVKYLEALEQQIAQQLPTLKVSAIHAEYMSGLQWLSTHSKQRNFVLFLGSSIGNFTHPDTEHFLGSLQHILHHGDYVLIGFDLRKDISILMDAYNDDAGITRDFNMNLIERINRELGADFDVAKFSHYATYNVYSGAMESYLISRANQTIKVDALKSAFNFQAFEPIHLEYSHKYLIPQIEKFANSTGFQVIKNFTDSRQFFVDSLWQVKKEKSTSLLKG